MAAVVIGEVTADVVNSGTGAAELAGRTYAAAVVPIIEESTALGLWLTDARSHPLALGRVGLETALGRLVAGSHSLELQLANLGLPPPNPRSGRLFSDVLTARATAARLMMGGVALAIGPSRDVTGATATLVRAGEQIAGSDGDYSRFVSSLPPYVRRSVPLPQSRWDTPSEWTAPSLGGFAALLSSDPRLLIHRSLVIVAISLQPPALRIVGLAPPAASPGSGTTTGSSRPRPDLDLDAHLDDASSGGHRLQPDRHDQLFDDRRPFHDLDDDDDAPGASGRVGLVPAADEPAEGGRGRRQCRQCRRVRRRGLGDADRGRPYRRRRRQGRQARGRRPRGGASLLRAGSGNGGRRRRSRRRLAPREPVRASREQGAS